MRGDEVIDTRRLSNGVSRTKREVKNPKKITMRNGRPATQGYCTVCGAKVFKIGKS